MGVGVSEHQGELLAAVQERRSLVQAFDSVRAEIDANGSMAAMDRYGQQAVEMIAGMFR